MLILLLLKVTYDPQVSVSFDALSNKKKKCFYLVFIMTAVVLTKSVLLGIFCSS